MFLFGWFSKCCLWTIKPCFIRCTFWLWSHLPPQSQPMFFQCLHLTSYSRWFGLGVLRWISRCRSHSCPFTREVKLVCYSSQLGTCNLSSTWRIQKRVLDASFCSFGPRFPKISRIARGRLCNELSQPKVWCEIYSCRRKPVEVLYKMRWRDIGSRSCWYLWNQVSFSQGTNTVGLDCLC